MYLKAYARYIINEFGEGESGELDEKLAIVMTFARQLRIRGREEGIQEGEKKALEHVAQAMVANGFSIDQIAKVTQLPIEKLQQIRIQ